MFFGHENKIKAFKKLVREERLGHAYLFFGDSQIGKKLFTKSFAYFLEYGKFEILSKPLIDTTEITAKENNSIGINDSRNIKRFLYQTPFCSSKRLVIIDNVERLTPEAQASLLKIIEEPPSHALVVFIAQNSLTLLPPLLSRLNQIYFSRLPRKKIEDILVNHYQITSSKAKKIAVNSFGRIGRAITLMESSNDKLVKEDLGDRLEDDILKFRQNIKKNSKLLAWLLEQELLIKRYNLNPKLQQKAIEYQITHNS